jgi:CheY-like chemotaxis protein
LRTCLVNLVKNSAEAMPDGGRITLSTGEYCSQVYVRVADTGTGMDWETQKKIFQPFYSTKGFESGRGLGMAQVYSTIRDHNGDVYIKESEVGKGTVMEFTLPCTGKKEIPERKSASAAGSARILWVDDEEMIRLLGKSMLKTLGHDADMASSGAEALEYLAKGNEYDLVITDVGMPEMSGWQLVEKIKSEGYTTKMAVLTGWGSEISQEDKDRYNVAYVLGKPVALKDLKALINDVLGGKAD